MKIDEACINHNVVEIIESLIMVDCIDDEMANFRIYNMGYLDGAADLTKRLKEVLKV